MWLSYDRIYSIFYFNTQPVKKTVALCIAPNSIAEMDLYMHEVIKVLPNSANVCISLCKQ